MGHRGSGMNMLQSCDRRTKSIKENAILSFNSASKLPLDFIQFDVQVIKRLIKIVHLLLLITNFVGISLLSHA
uniref:GP-PDE domain-containing protein n=1 Tax=Populus trichocarpa TaxID=3694 RepID=B9N110_POPTR